MVEFRNSFFGLFSYFTFWAISIFHFSCDLISPSSLGSRSVRDLCRNEVLRVAEARPPVAEDGLHKAALCYCYASCLFRNRYFLYIQCRPLIPSTQKDISIQLPAPSLEAGSCSFSVRDIFCSRLLTEYGLHRIYNNRNSAPNHHRRRVFASPRPKQLVADLIT